MLIVLNASPFVFRIYHFVKSCIFKVGYAEEQGHLGSPQGLPGLAWSEVSPSHLFWKPAESRVAQLAGILGAGWVSFKLEQA